MTAVQQPRVSDVLFRAASTSDRATGLLGFVTFTLDAVRLDGVTVRRTQDGRLVLSFPERKDARGGRHPYVLPRDEAVRQSITEQVLGALRVGGG